MHADLSFRHWMHHVHDGSAKVAHYTGHMLHEKSFWGILAIVALIAALFTLVVLFGENAMQGYRGTLPYGGPYY